MYQAYNVQATDMSLNLYGKNSRHRNSTKYYNYSKLILNLLSLSGVTRISGKFCIFLKNWKMYQNNISFAGAGRVAEALCKELFRILATS